MFLSSRALASSYWGETTERVRHRDRKRSIENQETYLRVYNLKRNASIFK